MHPDSLAELIVHLKPAACLRGQFLLTEGVACPRLYLLSRGSLRLSSSASGTGGRQSALLSAGNADDGNDDNNEEAGSSIHGACCARLSEMQRPSGMMRKMMGEGAMATAQMSVAAAATAHNADKKKLSKRGQRQTFLAKALNTFRIVEREGALIGCPLDFTGPVQRRARKGGKPTAPPIPFSAESLKLSHLLYLESGALSAALDAILSADSIAAERAIAQAHKMHLDSLKLPVASHLARAAAGEAPTHQQAPTRALDAGGFRKQMEAESGAPPDVNTPKDMSLPALLCEELRAMTNSTACLIDLVQSLRAKHELAGSSTSGGAPATASLMAACHHPATDSAIMGMTAEVVDDSDVRGVADDRSGAQATPPAAAPRPTPKQSPPAPDADADDAATAAKIWGGAVNANEIAPRSPAWRAAPLVPTPPLSPRTVSQSTSWIAAHAPNRIAPTLGGVKIIPASTGQGSMSERMAAATAQTRVPRPPAARQPVRLAPLRPTSMRPTIPGPAAADAPGGSGARPASISSIPRRDVETKFSF